MNNVRIKAAEIFREVTPNGPVNGPPLPEGLSIPWPGFMKYNLPEPLLTLRTRSQNMYYGVKDKIFYGIRGM